MKIVIALLLIFVAGYALGVVSFDTDRVLIEDIVLIRENENKSLHINFSAPVRVIGSFPEASGNIAQIKLRPIALDEFAENLSLLERHVGVEEGKELYLSHMQYEGNVPGGPFIVMKFEKNMRWELEEGDGLLAMNIIISEI